MTAAVFFLPDQEVEWVVETAPSTRDLRTGRVVPRDSEILTDDDRRRADAGDVLPVLVDYLGAVELVSRDRLQAAGTAEHRHTTRTAERNRGHLREFTAAVVDAQVAMDHIADVATTIGAHGGWSSDIHEHSAAEGDVEDALGRIAEDLRWLVRLARLAPGADR